MARECAMNNPGKEGQGGRGCEGERWDSAEKEGRGEGKKGGGCMVRDRCVVCGTVSSTAHCVFRTRRLASKVGLYCNSAATPRKRCGGVAEG
eukprot:78252-Chlamydomonas_euryale.AAC.1